MSNQENIIRLAEWMGYRQEPSGDLDFPVTWFHPNGSKIGEFANWYVPINPYADSNDCHLLIEHMNELKWQVHIRHRADKTHSIAVIKGLGYYMYVGYNYMYGVCELSLKAREQGQSDE